MRQVVRRADLVKIRDTNLEILENEEGVYEPLDLDRASRILIRLRECELKIERQAAQLKPKEAPEESAKPVDDNGPVLIDQIDHLKIVG